MPCNRKQGGPSLLCKSETKSLITKHFYSPFGFAPKMGYVIVFVDDKTRKKRGSGENNYPTFGFGFEK